MSPNTREKTKSKGAALWDKAKTLIPGGNQLLSKRAEMFLPGQWPAYYEKAKGVDVWDLDGRRLTDMSIMGIGTCILGYADDAVNQAVKRAIDQGSMCTLNCPEEVALAEKLIELHPWAGMARFARTGGEACTIAVRIARAASGKDKVAFCGYHGWGDWYLSANLADSKNLDGQLLPGLEPLGVPRALKGTSYPFTYGKLEELVRIFQSNPGEIGVVIMEVGRNQAIDVAFLQSVRDLAHKNGAVLIFDEVTSGFRISTGGMHRLYGVDPDIVILGKALGNGFPIAAVLGRTEVMNAAQSTFISSTYWTERVGFAAALEVIRQFESRKVAAHITEISRRLVEGLKKIFGQLRLQIEMGGITAIPAMLIHEPDPLVVKTVFTQEMLKRGYLASTAIYLSLAHTPEIIDRYLAAAGEVFATIAKHSSAGTLESALEGPVCHSGFKRLT